MAIGLPYRIKFTDPSLPGKDQFTIEPNSTDGPLTPTTNSPDSSATGFHTSVVLPGHGLPQYGGRVAETLVHMLEHFAGDTEPVAPTIGQLWYHYSADAFKYWDGGQWQFAGAQFVDIASMDEYNELATILNNVIGTPVGTNQATVFGYNQQMVPLLTARPIPANWTLLFNKIQQFAAHQATVVPTLTMSDFRLYGNNVQTFGAVTLLKWFQQWSDAINLLSTNRHNVDATTLESSVPSGANSARTTSWSRTIQHQLVLTFASDAHMRAFFNTGGSINLSGAISNTSTTPNAEWAALFASLGTMTVKSFACSDAGGTQAGGFYSLVDGVEKEIFYRAKTNHSGLYGNGIIGYHVTAKKNVAAKTLTITVKLVNGPDSGIYQAPEAVTGTIQSSLTLTKVSPLHVNTPEIAYPNVTATILLTAGGN